jgi:thiamine-monophosphate kinase
VETEAQVQPAGSVPAGSLSERVAGGQVVGELDESQLLARIFPRLHTSPSVLVGPGDDAAVIAAPDGRTVISVDTQVQDRDFRLVWPNGCRTSGFDVGWKAAAQNLSDINAMGAAATAMVVSLTVPEDTPVSWVEQLAEGLTAGIVQLGAADCSVAGGDLGGGSEISVTAAVIGSLAGRSPVLRSGARAGDILALAGTVGYAAAGLALLESAHPLDGLAPELAELVGRQLRPRPPLAAGPAAAAAGVHALMDISDGLVRDAGRMARASGVGIDLLPAAVRTLAQPLLPAAELLGADPALWVLGGGEDHGLLGVFPPRAALPEGFVAIGSVNAGSPGVTVGGEPPASVGWDHFAN